MKSPEPIADAQKTPGESSLLKQALLAIQQMKAKLDAAERRNAEPIAAVGLGCRFPGDVVDGGTFWDLLREGRDAISVVPCDRWDADAYFDPNPDTPGKMVTRRGGFLDRVDGFDARFFEIAPREAASMDPQQRLALEVAWETLENAGIAPASLRGTRTGVFLGIASSDYSQLNMDTGDAELLDAHYASGVAHSIASGRISYLLGLEGPSVSLDTACSSSLVAVHLACQSLRAGDCTLALAGGVNLMLAPETTALLSRVRMLSPDGRCKAFDDKADGFVRGEGCGFVALKRLSEAQADGDRILAVIRGTAVNQDGASSSLTAPNGPSQVNLMRQALANGGVAPDQVSYIEAHGTGTALGDPIELQSLGAVYGVARTKENLLPVGSLKTNVGHLEAAAGVAGLIKTILALEHGQIPPSLHFERPTSHVRWGELRLRVPTKLIDWGFADAGSGSVRVAGVSSFGFSGTNAHVVIEEAPRPQIAREALAWPMQILTVSAKSAAALTRGVGQYREYLESHRDADLRDFCFTANSGRSHFAHRACFLAPDFAGMEQQLAGFEVGGRTEEAGAERIGFLFTGQGSQYAGMGRELYESSAVFRSAMERCAA
ncbi:MAG: type I polyketide synthase, partial [Acidobacteriaceae bacterium]